MGLPKLPEDRQVLVIQALGQNGNGKAAAALIQAARTGSKAVRLAAIRSAPHDILIIPVLVDLLSDADTEVAQAARDRLTSLPEPAADAAIVKLFDNPTPALRIAAAKMAGIAASPPPPRR